MYLVLLVMMSFSMFISFTAHASRTESGAGQKFYLNDSGKQINALEADKEATNDKKVFQCQPVEKVCNEKTQKCTIKAVK
jgi:hypothetical protein